MMNDSITKFRNAVDKYIQRSRNSEISLEELKSLVENFGPLRLKQPPYSFKIYIKDGVVINEHGNKRTIVDESDSISLLTLIQSFKNDIELFYEKKLCVMSDLHGNLIDFDKSVDYVLIGGDICPDPIEKIDNEKWFIEKFIPWASPVRGKVIFIAGNHDEFLWNNKKLKEMLPNNIIYLENEFYLDDEIEIFGTPLCKNLLNKESNNPFFKFEKDFSKIWEGLNFDNLRIRKKIILSHDAPYGISDSAENPEPYLVNSDHLGSKSLLNLILSMKPDINFHGHIHSSNHNPEFIGNTEVRCVSLLDEDMKLVYKPYYLKL